MEEFRNKVRSASRSIRYGVGMGMALLFLLVRLILNPYWGLTVPLITFYPAVLLAAWFGGFGPGLVCTLVSAAAASYFFLEPLQAFRIGNSGEVIGLMIFVAIGVLISGVIEMLDRATDRYRRLAERLAREMADRTLSEERLRTVQQIVDTTIPVLGLDDLLRDLLRSVRVALKGDTATVLLLREDGVHLEPIASEGLREDVDEKIAVPLGTGVAGQIAVSESGLLFGDLSQTEVVSGFLRERIMSLIGVPLKLGARLIGVMHVGSTSRHSFTADDLVILRLVADRAAHAIERARLLEAEQKARAAADSANRAKDEFLAMVTHDLRSPLQSIIGAASILRTMPLPEKVSHLVSLIERSAHTETRLVNDLVDMTRVSTGKLTLNLQAISLRAVIGATLESVQPQFDAKHLHVEWTQEGPERILRIDPDRMQQIVTNLLTNAAKFNTSGGWIKVHLDESNSSHVELTVSDSGIGIDPHLLRELFTPFRQAEIPERHSGLGLGLAIVKGLVDLHRGTIQARSAGVGQGSTFSVKLPIVNGQAIAKSG
jgi:hypothetical protein